MAKLENYLWEKLYPVNDTVLEMGVQLRMIFNHGYSIKIDANRCLNQWHEGAQCTHCIDNCPSNALLLDENEIGLNRNLCIGCGLCLSDCPTQAFSSNQWDETTIVGAVEKEEWEVTELFCANHSSPYKQEKDKQRGAIQLPACLSTISKGGYYELGSITKLELHQEQCETCPMAKTLTRLEYNTGTAAEWLKASGREINISFLYKGKNGLTRKNLRAIETGLKVTSRRELFVSLINRGRNELIKKVNEFADSKSSTKKSVQLRPGKCLPDWRKRLADIYPKDQTNVSNPAFWPTIEINDKCVKCEMCSKFCPAGALQTVMEKGELTHFFNSGLCIDCRTCQLFCSRQAITRDRKQIDNPFEIIPIASKRVATCQTCGKPTYDQSKHLCYMCEKDSVNEDRLVTACKKMFFSIGNT